MNRRNFLSLFSAGVAGIALEQAIPLGRVWSFPKEIVIPEYNVFLEPGWISLETLRILKRNLDYRSTDWEKDFTREFAIGEVVQVKFPERFIDSGPRLASAPSAPRLPAGPVEIGPWLATRRNS